MRNLRQQIQEGARGRLRGGAQRRRRRRITVWLSIVAVALVALAWRFHVETPRVWAAKDVPVAFWAWRDSAPAEAEVARAALEARAQTLFLRAGQFDLAGGNLRRIRAADGRLPRALPLQLVYNATRGLLAEFERIDEGALAAAVVETFRQDLERAATDGAQVSGLQLDFDVPTRLLPRYERLLRRVRAGVPPRTLLSITGLPTWMNSASLGSTLDAADFWVPQCYGATIPERLEDVVPISSPELVAQTVARARRLGHPFYAGLAAYGYAILYDARGALVELRGDLDPAVITRSSNFELIERRPFPAAGAKPAGSSAASTREWRYVYRALGDGLFENMSVRAGDRLLLDAPSAETLRASARSAREQGGARLLGLCIFRLPGEQDPTTLTLPQITAALDDSAPAVNADVLLTRDATAHARRLRIEATNSGAAGALFGDDALALTIRVPAGSVGGVVSLENIATIEPLCGGDEATTARELRPCSLRRADTLRLRTRVWQAGERARAVLDLDGDLPRRLNVRLAVRADDGRAWQSDRMTEVEGETR